MEPQCSFHWKLASGGSDPYERAMLEEQTGLRVCPGQVLGQCSITQIDIPGLEKCPEPKVMETFRETVGTVGRVC